MDRTNIHETFGGLPEAPTYRREVTRQVPEIRTLGVVPERKGVYLLKDRGTKPIQALAMHITAEDIDTFYAQEAFLKTWYTERFYYDPHLNEIIECGHYIIWLYWIWIPRLMPDRGEEHGS